MDAEQTARKIALRIRERHLLNVALAAIAGKEGDLREACDLAEQAIATALREAAAPAWRPIETAPLAKMVLLWAPAWRHPFPGQRNGEQGAVWIDTCEPEARGWQGFATHWMPLPSPPSQGGGT